MKIINRILTVVVSLTVINVWLFRSNRSTSYRGGDAASLLEEFQVYGLEDYFLIIGIIKVSLAIMLLLSLYFKKLSFFASSGIGIMMLVAVYMHINVGDELIKSMPASVMLASCLIIAYSSKKSVKWFYSNCDI